MRARRAQAGFTLLEVVIAGGLATLVVLGLSAVVLPLVRAQALSAQGASAQMGAAAALSATDREIRQATWIATPSLAGVPSDRLEGCDNARAPRPPAGPEPLDPSAPMRWFAFCVQDGLLYYHAGQGCPAAYQCGRGASGSFGGGREPRARASFVRPATGGAAVDVSLTLASGEASSSVEGGAAYAAAEDAP